VTLSGLYFTQLVREEADKTVHACGRHYGVETFTQGPYVHSPLDGDDSIMKMGTETQEIYEKGTERFVNCILEDF
jgi:hypothetical protein